LGGPFGSSYWGTVSTKQTSNCYKFNLFLSFPNEARLRRSRASIEDPKGPSNISPSQLSFSIPKPVSTIFSVIPTHFFPRRSPVQSRGNKMAHIGGHFVNRGPTRDSFIHHPIIDPSKYLAFLTLSS